MKKQFILVVLSLLILAITSCGNGSTEQRTQQRSSSEMGSTYTPVKPTGFAREVLDSIEKRDLEWKDVSSFSAEDQKHYRQPPKQVVDALNFEYQNLKNNVVGRFGIHHKNIKEGKEPFYFMNNAQQISSNSKMSKDDSLKVYEIIKKQKESSRKTKKEKEVKEKKKK